MICNLLLAAGPAQKGVAGWTVQFRHAKAHNMLHCMQYMNH